MHFDCLFERETQVLEGLDIGQDGRVEDLKLLRALYTTVRVNQEHDHTLLIGFEHTRSSMWLIVLIIVVIHV